MIKPTKATKAELYDQLDKTSKELVTAMVDRDWFLKKRDDLSAVNVRLSNEVARLEEVADELDADVVSLEKVNFREREAGVAAFNRYQDHLAKYRRQLNRANWYVAAMFVATVAMAAMAAVAIFV